MVQQAMRFVIGIADFDLDLIPPPAREVGSTRFQEAITAYFRHAFAELGGTVAVEFDLDAITVTWEPVGSAMSLPEQVGERLAAGDVSGAAPLLQALAAVEPTNAEAHYNLGMVLSDLGDLATAQLHLLKALHLAPEHVNALVALGVALYRSGDSVAARRRLEQAVAAEPANGYAHRNLAAVLGNLGEREAAIEHFRATYRLLPEDQTSPFGLACALDDFGGESSRAEADRLYKMTIAINPDTEIAELARRARSRIAQANLHSTASGLRMDAVMYCLGALERFATMTPQEVQGVGFEIAMLGQRGIDPNNPDRLYTLRTYPGSFTGLHLMSLMYVAFKQVAPEADIGFDLSAEYAAANQLFDGRPDHA